MGATVLSIESQGKGLATMIIFALLLGLAFDYVRSNQIGSGGSWPLGAVSVFISLVSFYLQKMLQGKIIKDKTAVKAEILLLASPRYCKFAMESIKGMHERFFMQFYDFFLKKI